MSARYSRRLIALGTVSLVLLALVGVTPGAEAAKPSAGAAAAASVFPGRSTIPHLSARLAALAVNPAASTRVQARVAGLAESGPGSLVRQAGTNRLLVDIRVARWDEAVLARLRHAGATIVHLASALRTVTAAVAPAALRAIARVSGVQYVGEIEAPQTNAVCDNVISEGDQILHAVDERTSGDTDGTGVTVGILSDSFDTTSTAVTHATDDVTSDNLPGTTNTCGHTTPVGVLQDFSAGTREDEGRAMAQIVHDLAPGARILFATAEGGIDAFADNIRALADAGANVIVDDVSYFSEPFYQDGPIAQAVNDVRAMGVDYFSSAANNDIILGGKDVSSYEAAGGYRVTTCPATMSAAYTDCHNFAATGGTADPTYGFTMKASRQILVVLNWAEPQFGVKTDYALCVLSGSALLGCIDDRNPGSSGSQQANEIMQLTSGSSIANFSLVVARYGGNHPNTNAKPRFKFSLLTNGSGAITDTEYKTSTGSDVIGPTIFGHNGTSGAVSTAASDVRVSPSTVNTYSSRGPVTLLFGPVVGTTPAARLATPRVLAKPDLTASDCAINTFFGSNDGSHFRFCGTSAAAPHAAAVAALLLQQNPDLTPDQLNAALKSTAADLGLPSSAQGAGLIDAAAAGAAVVPKAQTISFTQPGKSAVGGSATLRARASSGLPVRFTVSTATRPAGACTVSGTNGATVKYRKVGSCVIRANQPGNALYHAAAQVSRSVVVRAAPTVTTKSLPSGVVGKNYAVKLTAKGGNAPLNWRIASGALPAGLRLAKSGAISGKPSKAGTFHITAGVTDSSAPKISASKKLTITIAPLAVRTTVLPSGRVGKKYSARLSAYGGKTPLTWKITSGKLPSGLSLARSGAISGKPTKAGTSRVTVGVTDSARHKASKALTIVVKAR